MNVNASRLHCEALGLIPRCLRRNSEAFLINTPPLGAGLLIFLFDFAKTGIYDFFYMVQLNVT